MNPALKSLLRMAGIDADHPEQLVNSLLLQLGLDPQQVTSAIQGFPKYIDEFNAQFTALAARCERIETVQAQILQLLQKDLDNG